MMTRNEIIALARDVFKDAKPDERDAFIREVFGPEYVGEEVPNGMECPTGSWATIEAKKWAVNDDSLPDACKTCSNHPRNGGSGFCLCTLGSPKIT